MDLPIGAEVVHAGTKYKVIESSSCWFCAFFVNECGRCGRPKEILGHCSALLREDGRAVSFIKV